MRLGGVLDQHEIAIGGQRAERAEVGALAVQVHRYQRLRPRRARRLCGRRVERPGLGIDVGEHGGRPCPEDPRDRRDARVRGGDHLVARADPVRPQRQRDRVGPRVDPDGVRRAAVRGELRLEPLERRAADEPAAGENRGERVLELVARGAAAQVEERDRAHQYAPACSR